MDRIENGFQKTFFLGQAQEVILNFFRPNAPESLDQFLKKTGLHDAVTAPNHLKKLDRHNGKVRRRFNFKSVREQVIQRIQLFPAPAALPLSAFPRADNSVQPAPGSSQGCPSGARR